MAIDDQVLVARSPRCPECVQLRGKRFRLSARRGNDVQLAARVQGIQCSAARDYISYPVPVRREARPGSLRHDSPLSPAQRGDNIETTAVSVGSKHNPAAVRREGRFNVVGAIASQRHWFAVRQMSHPDIEIAFARPIGCIREKFAVGGYCRICVKSGIEG